MASSVVVVGGRTPVWMTGPGLKATFGDRTTLTLTDWKNSPPTAAAGTLFGVVRQFSG